MFRGIVNCLCIQTIGSTVLHLVVVVVVIVALAQGLVQFLF